MKTMIRCASVVMLLLSALPASAGRVGFLDAERAVQEVGEGKLKMAELKEWATPREEELDRMAQQVNELQDRLAQQQRVASEEALEQLATEEREARRAFEDAKRAYERELTSRHERMLKDVATKVGKVASDYGKINGFDAIFVLNAQPLVYLNDDADITDTVIRLYNERFPPPKDIRDLPAPD